MSEPVLSVENLTVGLSRTGRVIDGISLDIAAGEIIGLVGESGSGKSTIGLALQGLLPPESQPTVTGSIRIDGVEIVGATRPMLKHARRSLVRTVPQDPMAGLDPTMIIRKQMAESTEDASIIEWLRRTGLSDAERIAESYPHRLSGGQRQRVLIAMSMMAHPKLLIADEPTTALDVTTQAQILELLRDLASEQRTAVLLITHDLAVAASIGRRLLVLHSGEIVERGEMRKITNQPSHPYTVGLLASRFDLSSDRSRPLPTPGQAGVGAWPTPSRIKDGTALAFSGVSKGFPTGPYTVWGGRRIQPVLRSIDLSIRLGECMALVGESGSGKSTILRIAAGLLTPDGGAVVRADDVPPQIVFQDAASSLTPWLTIGEQISERLRALRLSAPERRRRLVETMELVGLSPALMDVLPGELSGGQAQRAVVARAVVVPPTLLLCDEPISAMDVPLAAATLNLLGGLRRRLGMAMLFVTHNLAAARIIADRIAVLKDGKLVEEGDPDTLLADPATAYTQSLIAAVPRLQAAPHQ